jgi:hypothetical protein
MAQSSESASESHTGETIAYAEGDEDVVQLIEVWTSGRRRKGVRFFHFRWLLGYTTLFGALLFGLLWMAIVAVPSIFGASILDPGGATYGLAGFSAAVSILIVGFAWRRCLAEGDAAAGGHPDAQSRRTETPSTDE